ncbi:MAG: glycosyltransferase family 9 protein [Anaerolineae bacterium]|nr:glycosyltransferase family 9 protein [Anaerolineae bacterium]
MRIIVIRPCCIGDVMMATPVLAALRAHYPDAHITLAVSSWARRTIEFHPALNAILDTGPSALPVKSPTGFIRFVTSLQMGEYDLAISLVRSPLMSLAVRLSRIPQSAGIASGWRGFGYTVKAPVDPAERRHEAEIYLSVVAALDVPTEGFYANLSAPVEDQDYIDELLEKRDLDSPFAIINPAGGSNPGMKMVSKRWPPERYAQLADKLADEMGYKIVLLGGPDDSGIVNAVRSQMNTHVVPFIGELTFPQISAIAAIAALYIGNDTGLTHIAAASGAPTVAIFGPSDPVRYAPYTQKTLSLWRPAQLAAGGVDATQHIDWDWERDGISVEEALAQIRDFIAQTANTH